MRYVKRENGQIVAATKWPSDYCNEYVPLRADIGKDQNGKPVSASERANQEAKRLELDAFLEAQKNIVKSTKNPIIEALRKIKESGIDIGPEADNLLSQV